jgi:cytochrome c556
MSAMRGLGFLASAGALVVTAVAANAAVNFSPVSADKAKAVMHARHEGMESVGKSMKALYRASKADPVDLATARTEAARMNGLAKQADNWFRAGTGPDKGKTGAKAEIWKTPKDFADKLARWQQASAALNIAAKGGDSAAIQTAFGDLGKSCKACHDMYRNEMKH